MSVLLIDIKTFHYVAGEGVGKFSHKLRKGTLIDEAQVFYQKEMLSPAEAYGEQLAQEFFRLIIPSQPETRLAIDPAVNTYFILSAEIDGFNYLPILQQDKFTNGTYKGLGQLVITAILLHEIDLKNGNIGFNRHGQVLKIDGDWCFAAIKDRKYVRHNKKITPELILSLPFPCDYAAYNWLDIWREAIKSSNSSIVDERLAKAALFRDEVNEAILKILLLPNEYIKRFVDTYVPTSVKADVYIAYLIERREELKLAVLKNESFKGYILSVAAQTILKHHVAHMKKFMAHKSQYIIEECHHASLESQVRMLYEELISTAVPLKM